MCHRFDTGEQDSCFLSRQSEAVATEPLRYYFVAFWPVVTWCLIQPSYSNLVKPLPFTNQLALTNNQQWVTITLTVLNRPFELYMGAISRTDMFTRSHIELVLRRSRGQPLHHTCSFIWYNVRACERACVRVQVYLPEKKTDYENTYSVASATTTTTITT